MAGLFFCLASAEGAGLLFFPCYNTTPYKRLQWLLYHMCNYTAHAIKQCTRLYRRFSGYLPCFAAIVWRCIQLYRTACATMDARTLCRPAQPPYYNKVYKGAAVRPCYGSMPDGGNTSQTMPARRGRLLPCADRWQVLTRYQQYRPGAPADGSMSPLVQGQPGGGLDAFRAW